MNKKVMIASSIFGFQDHLNQICALIEALGFDVLNSHYGTISADSNLSNLDNCLNAVRSCDIFLGIIRPFYGTGIIGSTSITHEEFREAIKLNKKRYFIAHGHVTFSRTLLKQFMYNAANTRTSFTITKTSVMDDIRVIDLYDEVIQSNIPVANRKGNWAQEFSNPVEMLRVVKNIFGAGI